MNSRRARLILSILVAVSMGAGCAVVNQNEVGVKRSLGKLQPEALDPGLYALNFFTTDMLRLPINTQNLEVRLDLPSREGLTVTSDISILYRIPPERAHDVLRTAGENYESEIILSIFRSAAADVCAQYMAKDMHSGERSEIEEAIRERMASLLDGRGFVIEAVLLKSIELPQGLSRSIEERMSAEQDSMRMTYEIEREKQEAERAMIAAQGQRDAQKVLAEGLTPEILELRRIEALVDLARSPNTKVILNGGSSMMMGLPPIGATVAEEIAE